MHRGNGRAFHHHRGAILDIKSKLGGVAAHATPRDFGAESRRLRAELPDCNSEPLRLVGEIVLDSRAWEVHEADRQ